MMTEKDKSFLAMLKEACRVVVILMELNIEEEKIKQILVKYFDVPYKQATNILEEEKSFSNR
ncbi:MAG: hypothetical protein IJV73_06455 [Clostridia bacterium]|nr:hypothetical protein [Clostridia bacterium]